MNKCFLISLIGLLLLGCNVGPQYRPPQIKMQAQWPRNQIEKKVSTQGPINLKWWQVFRDPLLDRYIHEVACHNLDVKIAEARICQARAIKQIALANFYPRVNASASANALQISKGTLDGFFKRSPLRTLVDRDQWIYSVGFDAKWELDLFGKTRKMVQASEAGLQETYEKRRSVLLSSMAETARSYVELRAAQTLYRITKKNAQIQRETLNLVKKRYRAGEGNESDVALAEAQLQNTESTLPNYLAQVGVSAYQMAVLMGKEPQAILKDIEKAKRLPQLPRKTPVSLPSKLLCQRPDLRAAERQLAAAVSEIGVAMADYFPQFNLSISNLAFQSTSIDTLFKSSSVFWFMGPQLSLPIFHGGQIKANVKHKEALAQEAFFQYKKVILEALQDVQAALLRYSEYRETTNNLRAAIVANNRSMRLAKKRFQYGEADYLAFLQTQGTVLNAEIQEVNAKTNALTALISLYKALGGGWENFEV